MKNSYTKILLVVVLSLAASCTRISHKPEDFLHAGEPVTGDVIFHHQLSDPQGLNPFTTNDNSASTLFKLVFDRLLEQDPRTTEFVPSIAESMPELSADHLTYTFRLRHDVRFSDGQPLTSRDVLFSFKAIKNPLILDASPLRNYFEDMTDCTTPDDYTVVVHMSKPYFMAEIQLGTLEIIPKHILDPKNLTDGYTIPETNDTNAVQRSKPMQAFSDWFGSAEAKRDPKLLIGSGPFVYESWKTGEQLVFRRNKNYWNTPWPWRKVFADALVGIVINDRTAAISAMKTEDIDFFENVPPPLYDEQMDTSKINFVCKQPYEQSVYLYVGWNTRKPLFSDKRVRQAMCHLFNRDYLMKAIMRGYANTIEGPVYRNRPEYDSSITGYEYSPARAKELLSQAGWRDSDGDGILDKMIDGRLTRFEFNMSINAGNEARENIAILFSNEVKNIGIKCNVSRVEWSVFLKQNSTHTFDAYIGSWINDNIPSDPLQIWHSNQAENEGSNYVGFKNKRADEIMEQNRVEFDPEKRKLLMREFQRIVHEEAPYTFLWTPQLLALYNKRLANVDFHPVRPGYLINEWFIPKHLQSFAGQ